MHLLATSLYSYNLPAVIYHLTAAVATSCQLFAVCCAYELQQADWAVGFRDGNSDQVAEILEQGFDAKLLLKELQEAGHSQESDGKATMMLVFVVMY